MDIFLSSLNWRRCARHIGFTVLYALASTGVYAQSIAFSGTKQTGDIDIGNDGVIDGSWSMSGSAVYDFSPQGSGIVFLYRQSSGVVYDVNADFDAQFNVPGVTYQLQTTGNTGAQSLNWYMNFRNYAISWDEVSGQSTVLDPDNELTAITHGSDSVTFTQPTVQPALNLDWSVTLPEGNNSFLFSANNGATIESITFTAISRGDMRVGKTVSASSLPEGASGSYTLNAANVGTGTMSTVLGFSLVDQLPSGVSYTSHSITGTGTSTGGSYDTNTGKWSVGDLQLGEAATLVIHFTVDAGQRGNMITSTITDIHNVHTDPNDNHDALSASFDVPMLVGAMDNTLSFGTPTALPNGHYSVPLTIVTQNTGQTDLDALQLGGDFATQLGARFVSLQGAPLSTITDASGTTTALAPSAAGTAFDGRDYPHLFAGSDGLLGIDDRITTTMTLIIDPNASGGNSLSLDSAAADPVDRAVTDSAVIALPSAPAVAPALTVLQSASTAGLSSPPKAGESVEFTFTVTNTGDTNLDTLSWDSQLTDDAGNALSFTSAPTLVTESDAGSDAVLGVGESWTYRASYTLSQSVLDSGGLTSAATLSALTPAGTTVAQDADDNDPSNGPASALQLAGFRQPALHIESVAGAPVAVFPQIYDIPYTVSIENTGNIALTQLLAQADLRSGFSPALIWSEAAALAAGAAGGADLATREDMTDTIDVDESFFASGFSSGGIEHQFNGEHSGRLQLLAPGTTLAVGAQGQIHFTVRVYVGEGIPAQGLEVLITAAQLNGTPVTNRIASPLVDTDEDGSSDTGESDTADRDGDGIVDSEDYDPQGYFYCEDDGRILPGGRISVSGPLGSNDQVGTRAGIRIVKDGTSGEYQWFSVGVAGRFTMTLSYPSLGTPSIKTPVSPAMDLTRAVDVYTGASNTGAGSNIAVGATQIGQTPFLAQPWNTAFSLLFDIEAGDPLILGNNIPMTNCLQPGTLSATMSANQSTAHIGSRIEMTVDLALGAGANLDGAALVTLLPAGMRYLPGSATIEGVAVEPTIAGNRLIWSGQSIVAQGSLQLRFAVGVTPQAPLNALTASSWVINHLGAEVSNRATLTVQRLAEAVFDCTDLIGKVFHDANENARHDAGEVAMAGARVLSASGRIISTDAQGRFHVPCGVLPQDSGANFILKLDPTSLPAGWFSVSENPRVVRVSAGKLSKLNFGVSHPRCEGFVGVELCLDPQRVFSDAAAANTPNTPWAPSFTRALEQLVAQLAEAPQPVLITLLHDGAPAPMSAPMSTHLQAIKDYLNDQWSQPSRSLAEQPLPSLSIATRGMRRIQRNGQ